VYAGAHAVHREPEQGGMGSACAGLAWRGVAFHAAVGSKLSLCGATPEGCDERSTCPLVDVREGGLVGVLTLVLVLVGEDSPALSGGVNRHFLVSLCCYPWAAAGAAFQRQMGAWSQGGTP
jgi:hypothetical protein